MHIAAELADEDMARYLLSKGAKHDARSTSGSTPFYRAARSGSVAIMTMLKAAGAVINATTFDNFTPLIEAVEQQHQDCVELLLKWNADPFGITEDGDTAISYARWHNNEQAAKVLSKCYIQAGRAIPTKNVSSSR